MEAPSCLVSVAERVNERLGVLMAQEEARWAAVDPDLAAPMAALRLQVASGGKRLRPAFCTWAFAAAGGDVTDPAVVNGSAAVELLHAFALAHDDVMDRSPERRGQPTTHVRFADHHRDARWVGDSAHFGVAVAILVGDLAYAYADRVLGCRDDDVARIWEEMRIEVNIGQYLDVLAEATGDASATKARRIVEYKTGRYSVVRPLQLGVALARGPAALSELLTRYGHPVGVAFQLRDDMLGAFGDATLTGKPVGDDLRQGKITPMMACARERATPAQRGLLDIVGTAALDETTLVAVQEVLHDTGAVAAIEEEIAQLTAEAVAVLDGAGVGQDAHQALVALAHYVADRPT